MYETEEQKRMKKEREEEHKQQIEEWTGLKIGETLFDSNVDNWKENISLLNERIIGKKQLVFII